LQIPLSSPTELVEHVSCPFCGSHLSDESPDDPAAAQATVVTPALAPACPEVDSSGWPQRESSNLSLRALLGGQALTPAGSGPDGPGASAGDPDQTAPPDSNGSSQQANDHTTQHVPGYDVIDILGRGGMGIVYTARHLALQRLVALKMVLAGAHAPESTLTRFRTEAEAVARLHHPGIVQIYDIGEHRGVPYFSLELCAGGSLAQKLRGAPLPFEAAAALVQKLALAMQAAHSQHIIHRDLKPGNILLTADGEPKITDFGLAKKLDDAGHTRTGAIMGTASYMAPEQARGDNHAISPRADIYSLGSIFYELLTGRPPFRGESTAETLLQVTTQEPVRPTLLQPRTPRDLETIALKCLEKEPSRRYATCQDLADDLGRWLRREPIRARPAGALERAWKWARRQPYRAAALALGVFAGVLLVVGVVGYQRRQIERLQTRGIVAKDLSEAELAEKDERLDDALVPLHRARAAVEAQRDDETRIEVEQRFEQVQRKLAARQQHQRFRDLAHLAMFHLTRFTGLDPEGNRLQARANAQAALKLYGLGDATSAADGSLGAARPLLTPAAQRDLVHECLVMLVIWAEAETDRATRLALLDRAKRLDEVQGVNSMMLQILRADGQDRLHAKLQPTLPLDWYVRGLLAYNANRFEVAEEACDQVLKQDDAHFGARYLRAVTMLRTSRWDEAKAGLTICLNARPAFTWPLVLRGYASIQKGIQRAQAEPKTAQAEYRSAQADFDRALQKGGDSLLRTTILINRGVLFIRLQQWPEALADLRAAAALAPEAFQPYLNMAEAYKQTGRLAEAAQALGQAIERAPQFAILYKERADLHLILKDRAAAQVDLEHFIRLAPDDESARPQLASALVALGTLVFEERHYEDALAHGSAALKAQPDYTLAHKLRAECLQKLQRKREAAEALDRYLELARKPVAKAYQARGVLHAEAGELVAALDVYSAGLQHYPDDHVLHYRRGRLYLLMRAGEAALADFDACLRLDAHDAEALCSRGRARALLHQVDKALADAEEARRLGPVTERLQYDLACLYAQLAAQADSDDPAHQQYVHLYRRRAGQRLTELIADMPPARRVSFWREQVRADPSLAPLRRSPIFADLAARYNLPTE
jgi:tetratricopeptide (TPR) repeat protein